MCQSSGLKFIPISRFSVSLSNGFKLVKGIILPQIKTFAKTPLNFKSLEKYLKFVRSNYPKCFQNLLHKCKATKGLYCTYAPKTENVENEIEVEKN